MADKLTPKQEAFCLAYVDTGVAAEAYRSAYNVSAQAKHGTIYVAASELMADPKIARRIKEIQNLAVEKVLYSKKDALEEYEEIRAAAFTGEHFGPAVAAVTGKAKLFGHLSDKLNHVSEDGSMTPKGMDAFYAAVPKKDEAGE